MILPGTWATTLRAAPSLAARLGPSPPASLASLTLLMPSTGELRQAPSPAAKHLGQLRQNPRSS